MHDSTNKIFAIVLKNKLLKISIISLNVFGPFFISFSITSPSVEHLIFEPKDLDSKIQHQSLLFGGMSGGREVGGFLGIHMVFRGNIGGDQSLLTEYKGEI